MNSDDPKKSSQRPPAPKPVPVKPVPVKPVPVKPVPVKPVPVKPVPVKPVPVKPVPVKPVPVAPASAKPVPIPKQPVLPKPVSPVRPVGATPVSSVAASGAARPIPVAPPNEADELSMLGTAPEGTSEEDEDAEVDVKRLKKAAPPWLLSTLLHVAIILIAALWFMPRGKDKPIEFEATFAEVEQLDDAVDLFSDEDLTMEDEEFSDELVVESVDDPLSAPLDMLADLSSVGATPAFAAPVVGRSLNGRTPGMKKGLVKAYGGTQKTEAAVALGLAWLKRNIDRKTGGWSLTGSYKDGGSSENVVAATAMALLAFQGAGHTTTEGGYKAEVRRAWKFLLSRQRSDGKFQIELGTPDSHTFYTHAQATIALCELYALTKQETLATPAQSAVDYLLRTQADDGGWRYQPNSEGDLSVTGWVVMALQSARMAGLKVPEGKLDRIRQFLDSVSMEEKSKYRYLPRDVVNPTMTAEGLLCRQYLGWSHDEPALSVGTAYISQNPIQWRVPNFYYWYYATQVMHHMEGELWEDWNAVMREEIPNHQVAKGNAESGSWFDENDRWSHNGGRMYSTCLCLYTLEVYYRHLPLYNSVYSE